MSLGQHKYFLSCDWGTSRFRIFLVEKHTHKIIESIENENGLKFIGCDRENKLSERSKLLKLYLKEQIDRMSALTHLALENVVIVASGMSSSTIGLVEIPYSSVPVSIIEPTLQYVYIQKDEQLPNPLYIFGGVKTADDVMRGEETILMGISEKISTQSCLCILPGTHSKHVIIDNGMIVNFKTFMTGEIFEVVSKYSILVNSVFPINNDWFDFAHFKEGVLKAQGSNILNSLFSIRTKELLNGHSKEENYAYFSGLLIGTELKELAGFSGLKYLIGDSKLTSLYENAFQILGYNDRLVMVSAKNAIARAHLSFLDRVEKKL